MLNIENEEDYVKIFLLLTLLYSIKFCQILTQILIKKLVIRIFIMVSYWNISKTINFFIIIIKSHHHKEE